MSQVPYYDRIELDVAARRRGTDGTLIVRGKFARTGLQTYTNSDGTERIEYRPEEEVRLSAATFNGMTVTDLHPQSTPMVTPNSWRELARGHLQDPVFVDGWLEGDFYISDGELAEKIERGERRELSAGYFALPKDEPGEYDGHPYALVQTRIRGNHVAALPRGAARAGPEAQLLFDSVHKPPPSEASKVRTRMVDSQIEVMIGGVRVAFTADAVAEQLLKTELSRTQTLETERDQLAAEVDTIKVRVAELETELASANDAALIDARVEARTKLVEQARLVGGAKLALVDGEHTLTDSELRTAALTAAGHSVEGKSAAYLEAALDHTAEAMIKLTPASTTADAARQFSSERVSEITDSMVDLWEARDRYLDRVAEGKEV